MSNRRKTTAMAFCLDCGMPTIWHGRPGEWYMVHDHVWAAARMPAEAGLKSYLCVGCIEMRLGRQLMPADFTATDVNDPAQNRMTPRLLDRLGLLHAR
jgi:hypothetical protein